MSFKNLFINSDENQNEPKKPEVVPQKSSSSTQFPKSETDVRETNNSLFSSFSMSFGNKTPEVKPIVSGSFSQEHFQKALEIYANN